jgi:hypothetical protein
MREKCGTGRIDEIPCRYICCMQGSLVLGESIEVEIKQAWDTESVRRLKDHGCLSFTFLDTHYE